jgi:hypothetical protein
MALAAHQVADLLRHERRVRQRGAGIHKPSIAGADRAVLPGRQTQFLLFSPGRLGPTDRLLRRMVGQIADTAYRLKRDIPRPGSAAIPACLARARRQRSPGSKTRLLPPRVVWHTFLGGRLFRRGCAPGALPSKSRPPSKPVGLTTRRTGDFYHLSCRC